MRMYGRLALSSRPGETPIELAIFPLSVLGKKVDMLCGELVKRTPAMEAAA